jgi:hypothetical protein
VLFTRACPLGRISNPKKRAMGSTAYGNAIPINGIGPALPQHFKIGRDGRRRVRIGGRI